MICWAVAISVGTVHHVLQSATQQAGVINREQDLSGIRVGLHDEIFHGGKPVLAGVDAALDLLLSAGRGAASRRRHLGRASAGCRRARAAAGVYDRRCRARPARGAEGRLGRHAMPWRCVPHPAPVRRSRQHARRASPRAPRRGARRCRRRSSATPPGGIRTTNLPANWRWRGRPKPKLIRLARDIRTLIQWLSHDVLALAGPTLATRQMLFDFIVEELSYREAEDVRRIRPLRVALQNQRNDLLAFAGVLDAKLAAIAQAHAVAEPLVREACLLHRLPSTSSAYWQGWNQLRAKTGGKFHTLFVAVKPGHGADPTQQFAGGESQLTTSQLLHTTPSSGRLVFRLTAVLPEPSPLHAQPGCRAHRQKPTGIDDRPRPCALADAVGPRTRSAATRLIRGG